MADDLVHLERRDDGVALIRLDRPPANALSLELLKQLAAIVERLADDLPGAIVVTGSPKIFAAGADIAEFGGPEEARVVGAHFQQALDGLAALPRASIAAVNGYALGGGCELALACDFRVASPEAKFGQPEILLGIIPGGGGTQRLARLIGPARAKEMIFTGRQVPADEAERIGLVDMVVRDGSTLDMALTLANKLATGAVVAQGMAKRAIDLGLDRTLAEGLDLEQQLFAEVFDTVDAKVGVKSFLDHGPGKAKFTGR